MKVCFYCDTLFSFGGVQRVLAVIAKALSEHHQVTILTRDDPSSADTTMYGLNEANIIYRYIQIPPIRWYEYLPCKLYSFMYKKILYKTRLTSSLYGYSSYPASQRKSLIKELNQYNYDAIIGVHAFLSLRLASVRKQLQSPIVIGWMHNSYQAFFENTPSYLEGLKSHFKYYMQRLDQVVVLTHADAAQYRENLGLATKTIYNPLTLRAEGHSHPEAKKFLAIGRFSPQHKGFDILIESFALFAQENDDWTLEIVGEGPEEKMLRNLIARHNLENRITIHPFTKQIQQHYVSSSVYILSSRWEGFGLVLIEAMAHGLPIISSDIPTSKELLKNLPFCFFFKNKDRQSLAYQMKKIVDSQNKLQQWGKMALEESKKYNIQQTMIQWEAIIQKKNP